MLPAALDWRRVEAFAELFLEIPKGTNARQPFLLEPFQRRIIRSLFPARSNRADRPRQALTSISRGNGKSTLAALVALYCLYADEVESAQVLCVASDLRQAGIVFGAAARMVALSPELAERTKIYQDRLLVPGTNSEMRPLPADEGALQGYDPSAAIVDELAYVTPEVWESVVGATGKRDRSLVWAISTPPLAGDSVMKSLADQAKAQPRPDFAYLEWTSDPSHDPGCLHCWRSANPALGRFLAADGLRSVQRTMRELSFRRLRLGQWIEATQDGWVTPDAWRACELAKTIPPASDVVISFDGSLSGDRTVIMALTVEETPHAELVRQWSPDGQPEDWTVPVEEVEAEILATGQRFNVREVIADPAMWNRSLQVLARSLPVGRFPQQGQQMATATAETWQAIQNRKLSHGGQDALTEQVLNAVVREDARGQRIYKQHKNSERKIDAAVAMIMGHSRARWHIDAKRPARRVRSFSYV